MKHLIRQQIKEKIKDIPSTKKQEYSLRITEKIIKKFGHLHTWHIYKTMPDEVDTTALIAYLEQSGKKIFYPDTETQEKIDIVIVPGRAFTHNNKRLGRGAGYYDRFLAQHPHTKKIGICFPQQIVDDMPQEGHDILMDEVITAE